MPWLMFSHSPLQPLSEPRASPKAGTQEAWQGQGREGATVQRGTGPRGTSRQSLGPPPPPQPGQQGPQKCDHVSPRRVSCQGSQKPWPLVQGMMGNWVRLNKDPPHQGGGFPNYTHSFKPTSIVTQIPHSTAMHDVTQCHGH